MTQRRIPDQAVHLTKSFEQLKDGDLTTPNFDPYLCPAKVWTIGWGHAIVFRGKLLRGEENRGIAYALYPGGITSAAADALLYADLLPRMAEVIAMFPRLELADNELAALLSFAFNLGTDSLATSTARKYLLAGDRVSAANWLLPWDNQTENGKLVRLDGLTRRRWAERTLFLGGDWRVFERLDWKQYLVSGADPRQTTVVA